MELAFQLCAQSSIGQCIPLVVAPPQAPLSPLQDRESVLTIVAAVLHIGNITFTQGDSDEAVISDEAAQQALLNVATFLEVQQQPFAFTVATVCPQGPSRLCSCP